MRILGVTLIIFSSGACGFLLASTYQKRVVNIGQLITFLQVLESEIQFAQATLPEIIARQSTMYSGLLADFLGVLNKNLKEDQGMHFSSHWEQGILVLEAAGLPRQILNDFHDLGLVLGTSDLTEQIKHLNLLKTRLEKALNLAEKEAEKDSRLWRYLGFSFGLLLVLLLL